MIPDKNAAASLAMEMAGRAIETDAVEKNLFLLFNGWEPAGMFDEVLHYKFGPEALFIHMKGKLLEPPEVTWPDLPAEAQLFFSLYTTLVPILNSWITPPPPVIEEPKPALPGRGFESINEDSSNRGTIYDREDWSKPQPGQAPAAPEGSDQAPSVSGSVAQTPLAPTTEGTGNQDHADVTENTDPEPLVTYEGQGEGGEVVDDDDDETEGAEGGSVEADENTPAVTDQQPKRRKR